MPAIAQTFRKIDSLNVWQTKDYLAIHPKCIPPPTYQSVYCDWSIRAAIPGLDTIALPRAASSVSVECRNIGPNQSQLKRLVNIKTKLTDGRKSQPLFLYRFSPLQSVLLAVNWTLSSHDEQWNSNANTWVLSAPAGRCIWLAIPKTVSSYCPAVMPGPVHSIPSIGKCCRNCCVREKIVTKWVDADQSYLSRLRPTTTSFSRTIFSCEHFIRMWISRSPDTGRPSFSWSMRTFFSATISLFDVSLARSGMGKRSSE